MLDSERMELQLPEDKVVAYSALLEEFELLINNPNVRVYNVIV